MNRQISFSSYADIPQSLLENQFVRWAFENIYARVGKVIRPNFEVADIINQMASIGFMPKGEPHRFEDSYQQISLKFTFNSSSEKFLAYRFCFINIKMLPLCDLQCRTHLIQIYCMFSNETHRGYVRRKHKSLKKEIITRYKDILEESKDIS